MNRVYLICQDQNRIQILQKLNKINLKGRAMEKSKKVFNKKILTGCKKDKQNNYKYPMETRHHFLNKLQMMNKNKMEKMMKKN